MSDYGYFDIYFTDDGDREKETLVEQISLKTAREAAQCAHSWQKSTWVVGRKYGYRATQMPGDSAEEKRS